MILTYFMVFPFGIPGETLGGSWEIEEGRFRVTDIMLVLSLLVYIACQYRIYGFVSQAVAFEGAVRRRDEKPTRRPPRSSASPNSACSSGSARRSRYLAS